MMERIRCGKLRKRGFCAFAHSEAPRQVARKAGTRLHRPLRIRSFPRPRPRPPEADIKDLARVNAVRDVLILLARGHWSLPRTLIDERVSVLQEGTPQAAPTTAAPDHARAAGGPSRRRTLPLPPSDFREPGNRAWRGDGVALGTFCVARAPSGAGEALCFALGPRGMATAPAKALGGEPGNEGLESPGRGRGTCPMARSKLVVGALKTDLRLSASQAGRLLGAQSLLCPGAMHRAAFCLGPGVACPGAQRAVQPMLIKCFPKEEMTAISILVRGGEKQKLQDEIRCIFKGRGR